MEGEVIDPGSIETDLAHAEQRIRDLEKALKDSQAELRAEKKYKALAAAEAAWREAK